MDPGIGDRIQEMGTGDWTRGTGKWTQGTRNKIQVLQIGDMIEEIGTEHKIRRLSIGHGDRL